MDSKHFCTRFLEMPNITGYIKIHHDIITSGGESCFSYPKYLEWNKSHRKFLLLVPEMCDKYF